MSLQQINELINQIPINIARIILVIIGVGIIHFWNNWGKKWVALKKEEIEKQYNRHKEILDAGVDYMVEDIHRHFGVILEECTNKGYMTITDISRWGKLHKHYEKFLGNTDYKYLEYKFLLIPFATEEKLPKKMGNTLPSRETLDTMLTFLKMVQNNLVNEKDVTLPINQIKDKEA